MSFKSATSSTPIAPGDRISPGSDFTHLFVAAAKPDALWRVGAEVELLGYTREQLERIDPAQVQAVIKEFSSPPLSRVTEKGFVTEVALKDGGGRLTLEPGGQVEFSVSPHRTLAETERAVRNYFARITEIAEANGILFITAGFDPVRSIEEQKWIPKKRYEIMRPYLARRGRRAWDMMCRTAAIQVNFDYRDLEDLAKKFLLANRLGPVAGAIFANSPFETAKLSGYKSTRYATWLETDRERTGPSPLALEDNFSIERFVAYVRSVPMFFIRRDGQYISFAGRSFDDFIESEAAPIFQDFTDHLSTIFTEARLKPHIEQRSMDCCSLEMTMAALAFWKGLMHSAESLDGAIAIAPKLNRDEFASLQLEVARHGLQARAAGVSVMALAEASIELARAGLKSVAPGEAGYLDVLEERVMRERISPADILIRNFNGKWNGDIRKAVESLRIAE
ncbi:MAG TPA: glutamate-cysteine ligase family protein [Blastocatellia bacterium]|jgi:glutamate--cysteine ligase